jgi:teichuronic acid biosynthesis glycosyltransferase TuaC
MAENRLRVLTISYLYPNPPHPSLGIFVAHQVKHMAGTCQNSVLCPMRIFPRAAVWKALAAPRRFMRIMREWRAEIKSVPASGTVNGIEVFYPRYTSPPRQIFDGICGLFAYIFLSGLMRRLNADRRYQLIHAHTASPCGVLALLAKRWMRVPVVLSVHGEEIHYTAKQHRLGAALVRWVFRHVDAIIAYSAWSRRQIIRLGADPEKIHIVHLGANKPPGLDSGARRENRAEGLELLSIANLNPPKGIEYVLRALRRLIDSDNPLHYTIVGEGQDMGRLARLTNDLHLSGHVTFTGAKPNDEIWQYLVNCDIFVLPSWPEAFGVVYIEALSAGKPVIACRGAGGPDDLKNLGDCVELVEPRNVDSLEDAIRRLAADPKGRAAMGEAGRKVAATYFTWEKTAVETLQVYELALRGNSPTGTFRAPSETDKHRANLHTTKSRKEQSNRDTT